MPETFLITIRSQPKHGILYAAAKQHGGTKAMAAFLGVSECRANLWVNLRNYPRWPFTAPGAAHRARERKAHDAILAKINTSLDECWPPEVRQFIDGSRELKSLILEQTQEVPLARLTGQVMQTLTVDGDAEQLAEQDELRGKIRDVLKTLSYREREIIKLRFGLEGGVPFTLAETGKVFGVQKERIRQIEAKALRKMQQPSRSESLVGFMD